MGNKKKKEFKKNKKLYKKIVKKMFRTYKKKNHDYGNSFEKTYKEFGDVAPATQNASKMERIKNLVKGKKPKVKEDLCETLNDLANYSIMWMIVLKKKGGKE